MLRFQPHKAGKEIAKIQQRYVELCTAMDTPEVGKFYLNWVKTEQTKVDELWNLRRNFLMKNPNNTNSIRRIKKAAKTKFV